jgi:hypothetical protein
MTQDTYGIPSPARPHATIEDNTPIGYPLATSLGGDCFGIPAAGRPYALVVSTDITTEGQRFNSPWFFFKNVGGRDFVPMANPLETRNPYRTKTGAIGDTNVSSFGVTTRADFVYTSNRLVFGRAAATSPGYGTQIFRRFKEKLNWLSNLRWDQIATGGALSESGKYYIIQAGTNLGQLLLWECREDYVYAGVINGSATNVYYGSDLFFTSNDGFHGGSAISPNDEWVAYSSTNQGMRVGRLRAFGSEQYANYQNSNYSLVSTVVPATAGNVSNEFHYRDVVFFDDHIILYGIGTASPFIRQLVRSGADTWSLGAALSAAPGEVYSIAVSPDRQYIMTSGVAAPYVRLFRVTGRSAPAGLVLTALNAPSPAVPGTQSTSCNFSPDGKLAVITHNNTQYSIYEVHHSGLINGRTFTGPAGTTVYSAAFMPLD